MIITGQRAAGGVGDSWEGRPVSYFRGCFPLYKMGTVVAPMPWRVSRIPQSPLGPGMTTGRLHWARLMK